MSTTRQVIAGLAPVCGIHPATMDRYMRELRSAGLIASSGNGGSIVPIHTTSRHMAHILMALTAPTACKAVEHAQLPGLEEVQAALEAGTSYRCIVSNPRYDGHGIRRMIIIMPEVFERAVELLADKPSEQKAAFDAIDAERDPDCPDTDEWSRLCRAVAAAEGGV